MPSLESGKRLADRYLLQERLGDGGHAEVWAAIDQHDGRRVALKFLHATAGGPDDAWRVLRHEAHLAQRLDHPGVLRIEQPQRDGHCVFLPMEYAGGGDASRLRGQAWQRVLPVLLEVAQVLEHAHSRGVVHRDIKPGNVLFDEQGAVRLTDFGAAARTGSTAALAAGSPFSASPQQLRDEAACTADDVYGLGALAYELLSGYPPHYPHFDAQRVQREMPQRLAPALPAPAALLDVIMSMLARDPAGRPDLQQVMQAFEHGLRVAASEAGAVASLVKEASPQPAMPASPPVSPTPRVSPMWWLAAAAALAAVAFMMLPRVSTVPEMTPISAPPVVAATPPPAVVAAAPEPADPGPQRSVADAAELELVYTQYSAALRAEAAGDLAQARLQYEAVLRQSAQFAPARAGLDRVQGRQAERQAEALLVQRRQRDAQDEVAGQTLERAERWNDAVAHYEMVLQRDAALLFAQDGLARSQRRAALDHELDDYIARADRLTATPVRQAAERAMARGEATIPRAPRLEGQLQQLRAALAALHERVRVAISSDNSTRIIVAPVGDLGVFVLRELVLPPGHYTVIGQRDGFRDVRRELELAPGQREAALSVQCTERI